MSTICLSPRIAPDATSEQLSAIVVANLPMIRAIVRSITRRHGHAGDDERELLSDVLFHLVESDYGVLRKFRGGSSLRTYLRAVIERVQLDRQVKAWGKWRPTARAVALGASGRRLERLIVREHLTRQEAINALMHEPAAAVDYDAAARLYADLKPRPRARLVPIDGWADRLGAHADEDPCAVADLRRRAASITIALQQALSALDAGDHHLLYLRYRDGLSVAEIARTAGLDQRRLYRRYDRILHRLRVRLQRAAVVPDEARMLMGHAHVEMGDVFAHTKPAA